MENNRCYIRLLFCLKGGNSDTSYSMMTSCSVKSVRQKKTSTVLLHFHEIQRTVKFMERKKKGHAWGTGERGNRELLFNGYRVSVLQDRKSSRD